jgi:hypothetical protein
MTADVCVVNNNIKQETSNRFYWFLRLLVRIFLVSFLIFLGVSGLIQYFWDSTQAFKQDQLLLFISCFFIIQLVWHFFSLFTIEREGVVRNRRSILMFVFPNHLLISGLTLLLAVFIFYWGFLFLPQQKSFFLSVFLIILIPQLFVRVWDFLARKESSILAGLVAAAMLLLLMAEEVRYGIGFRYLANQVDKVAQLQLKPGQPSAWTIPIPESPRWQRDGLTYYQQLFSVLNEANFTIDTDKHLALTPQARKLLDMGIVPFDHYQGEALSGLQIKDRDQTIVYQFEYPFQFESFDNIPRFLLKALLVWENDKLRHLILPEENQDNNRIQLNYLIEGPRIIKSLAEYAQYKLTGKGEYSGGSTLMTTLEKINNTPGGRTQSVNDKLKQMIGAGLHLYGDDAEQVAKKALVDFLNTVPMAGGPKEYVGALYGFGASYYAWFGQTLEQLQLQLQSKDQVLRAQAFKNICALIVSIRRPSQLNYDKSQVNQQANLLLKRLKQKELLDSVLYRKARALMPAWEPNARPATVMDYARHRESFSARNEYTRLFRKAVEKKSGANQAKLINLQSIDAMPVTIEMTTDARLEGEIRQVLDEMYTEVAQQSPFVQSYQKGLLNELSLEQLQKIEYGVMVLEIDEHRQWRILANTDTQSDKVYNPATQGRFQWGSTAKLRVLVNYLAIIHNEALKLQADMKALNFERLQHYKHSSVVIKSLLARFLEKNPRADMKTILNWAMSRRISADPKQKFLTGESWHQFHNYQTSDDKKNPDLWQMTTESINLSFVRLMRDVVNYYIDELGYDKKQILTDKKNRVRQIIIAEAIAREEQLYRDGLQYFIGQIKNTLAKNETLSQKQLLTRARLVVQQIADSEDKQAQQYHPLVSLFKRITYYEKAWLLARLTDQMMVGKRTTREAEELIIKQTSAWFKTSRSWIKNTLYTYMEREAFTKKITPAWKKLGYPFEVSPSYAVVLGSSGDTPMALLELAGTLLNDGIREKNISAVERIILSPDTIFETPFRVQHTQERAIPAEVARIAKKAMSGVLNKGTAIFASRHPLMHYVETSGAKTGTGDNRYYDRAVNRSAAVVSILDKGDNLSKYAICITMSVTEGDIDQYRFTSKIPVRILSRIADHLTPVIANKTVAELRLELATSKARRLQGADLVMMAKSNKPRLTMYRKEHQTSVEQRPEDSPQVFENLF